MPAGSWLPVRGVLHTWCRPAPAPVEGTDQLTRTSPVTLHRLWCGLARQMLPPRTLPGILLNARADMQEASIYMNTLRECYEAYVIYNFFMYLLRYLHEEYGDVHAYFSTKDDVPHMWGLQYAPHPLAHGRGLLLGVQEGAPFSSMWAAVRVRRPSGVAEERKERRKRCRLTGIKFCCRPHLCGKHGTQLYRRLRVAAAAAASLLQLRDMLCSFMHRCCNVQHAGAPADRHPAVSGRGSWRMSSCGR